MIVVDACVAIKWFIEEEDTPKAVCIQRKLLEGELTVIVPDLLFYEVINILKLKAVAELDEVVSALRILFELNLRVVPANREHLELAIYLSDKFNITIYDAIYVAIANDFNCPLITADKELIKKVKLPVLKHLNEYI